MVEDGEGRREVTGARAGNWACLDFFMVIYKQMSRVPLTNGDAIVSFEKLKAASDLLVEHSYLGGTTHAPYMSACIPQLRRTSRPPNSNPKFQPRESSASFSLISLHTYPGYDRYSGHLSWQVRQSDGCTKFGRWIYDKDVHSIHANK